MSEPLRTVNVGLIGLGTVGGGVARLIKSHHDEYWQPTASTLS